LLLRRQLLSLGKKSIKNLTKAMSTVGEVDILMGATHLKLNPNQQIKTRNMIEGTTYKILKYLTRMREGVVNTTHRMINMSNVAIRILGLTIEVQDLQLTQDAKKVGLIIAIKGYLDLKIVRIPV
jgi:hypothetical protein